MPLKCTKIYNFNIFSHPYSLLFRESFSFLLFVSKSDFFDCFRLECSLNIDYNKYICIRSIRFERDNICIYIYMRLKRHFHLATICIIIIIIGGEGVGL